MAKRDGTISTQERDTMLDELQAAARDLHDCLKERDVNRPEWWLVMVALKLQISEWGS